MRKRSLLSGRKRFLLSEQPTYVTTDIRITYYDLNITFQGASRRHNAQRWVSHNHQVCTLNF